MKTVAAVQTGDASGDCAQLLLSDLGGRPLLWRTLERVARCHVAEIVLLAGEDPDDDEAANIARAFGARCIRGPRRDVWPRMVAAARRTGAEIVFRVSAACPLFDAEVANRVIRTLADNLATCDYAANFLERTYPRGLECEAFTFGALTWIDRLARWPGECELATVPPARCWRQSLLCRSVKDDEDNSDLRWIVEEARDLEFVRRIYRELDLPACAVSYRALVAYVRECSPETQRQPPRLPRAA